MWSSSEASPLLHAPCLQLSQEAKSSILFASQSHSLVSDPPEPRVVFARASRFKQSEGTAVCSPRVADLYKAAVIANNKLESKQSSRQTCGLPYVAALGVGSQYKPCPQTLPKRTLHTTTHAIDTCCNRVPTLGHCHQ